MSYADRSAGRDGRSQQQIWRISVQQSGRPPRSRRSPRQQWWRRADEVSAAVAALFGSHAQAYQALSAQAAAFHSQFVQLVHTGAGHYALHRSHECLPPASAGQGLLNTVNARHPGARGTTADRQRRQRRGQRAALAQADGGAGGILFGNGGQARPARPVRAVPAGPAGPSPLPTAAASPPAVTAGPAPPGARRSGSAAVGNGGDGGTPGAGTTGQPGQSG